MARRGRHPERSDRSAAAIPRSLVAAGLGDTYEAAHARLAVACHATTFQRLQLLAAGKLARLPPASQYAADKSYFVTTSRLCEGLEKTLAGYEKSESPAKRQLFACSRNR